jgi:hypothetical protein
MVRSSASIGLDCVLATLSRSSPFLAVACRVGWTRDGVASRLCLVLHVMRMESLKRPLLCRDW